MKKLKRIYPIFIFIMLFNGVVIGQAYTYSDKLSDKNNKKPIEYGHVYLKGKRNGTLSIIDGKFSFIMNWMKKEDLRKGHRDKKLHKPKRHN